MADTDLCDEKSTYLENNMNNTDNNMKNNDNNMKSTDNNTNNIDNYSNNKNDDGLSDLNSENSSDEEDCLTEKENERIESDIVKQVNALSLQEGNSNNNDEIISKENVRENSKESIKNTPTNSKVGEPDPRPHLNVVFIGHVDAGKSTTCGNILYLSGQVDERTMEKYEKEARDKNRESWFLAFIMDVNEEERAKGKTVEVGRAHFETERRRFTILDAPGHKSFVPNMIEGAAQADIGVLIVSARKGEFETGFERGGQTREHALLAKTLGVNQLVVAVNKMDDPTCNWDEERYREIETKMTPYLKSCGYNPAKDVTFVPISGLAGQNIMTHVADKSNTKVYTKDAFWYPASSPTLWQIFDNLEAPPRDKEGPVRVPLLDGYKENGTIAVGKVESGQIEQGKSYYLMPNRKKVKAVSIYLEDIEAIYALPGENVRIKLMGVEEDEVGKGFVLCSLDSPCAVVTEFLARVAVVELLEHRPILTAGYSCVLHAHTACEEVEFMELTEAIDKKTKKKKVNPKFVKSDAIVVCRLQLSSPICLEEFDVIPQLGRFTIRDEGKTIGIGKVMKILN